MGREARPTLAQAMLDSKSTNVNGLTFIRWLYAAKAEDRANQNLYDAWRAGHDPADYRV